MKKSFFSDTLVLLLSLLSSIALMICQIVWLRMLGIFFGLHIFSVVASLASLMGGLALGGLIAGRLSDKISPFINKPMVSSFSYNHQFRFTEVFSARFYWSGFRAFCIFIADIVDTLLFYRCHHSCVVTYLFVHQ